jgi:microcin C transport system substrate-binding protein
MNRQMIISTRATSCIFLLLLFVFVSKIWAQTTLVAPELGGVGFDKLADSLGFKTYRPKADELFAFGDPRAKNGGQLRIGMERFPVCFRPFGQNTNYTENSIIQYMVYESLLDTHPFSYDIYIPRLASHWKISSDNRIFTFRIDPEARFSNGAPVTARDVIATWRLLMDTTILEPSLQLVYGKFKEPAMISPYMVEVESSTISFRNFLYFVGMPILSADEISSLTGTEFLEKYRYAMPVGTGEYIMPEETVIPENEFTFVRREDYWAREYEMYRYTGNFDRVQYKLNNYGYDVFLDGNADVYFYYPGDSHLWEDDPEVFEKGWVRKLIVETDGANMSNGFSFNMRRPPFDDRRVRKAFACMFDRQRIIQEILPEGFVPRYSHFNSTIKSRFETEYNPAKARRLLQEAGWTEKNGILTKKGVPFVVRVSMHRPAIGVLVTYLEALRNIGIDVRIDTVDSQTMYERVSIHDFDMVWLPLSGLNIPNPETSYHSRLADLQYTPNITGVKNAKIDALCDQYDKSFLPEQRSSIIQSIDDSLYALCIDIPGWYNPQQRISIWNKFGMPQWVFSRYTQAEYRSLSASMYWWYDEEKASLLKHAQQQDRSLITTPPIIEKIDCWRKAEFFQNQR